MCPWMCLHLAGGGATGTSLWSWQCLMAWDAWGWWTVQISVITKCIFMSSLNVNLVYTSSAPWVCPESKPEVSISRQQVCPCCVHTAHSMAGPWSWPGCHSTFVMKCLFSTASTDNQVQINDYMGGKEKENKQTK